MDTGADCDDGIELSNRLRELFVTRSEREPVVEIMTMHKAKGLEFDTVILPGLGYRTRRTDQPLLLWHELGLGGNVAGASGKALVVAPIKAAGQKDDPIYDLLWAFEKQRESLEQDRLLYVSVTRSRKRLHLFAQLQRRETDGEIADPMAGSLLQRFWPHVAAEIEAERSGELPVRSRKHAWQRDADWIEVPLTRLNSQWRLPGMPSASQISSERVQTEKAEPVEYDWAGRKARYVGEVVHQWLQQIATAGLEEFNAAKIKRLKPVFARMLRSLGTDRDELDGAVEDVAEALVNSVTDERGRWILSSQHQQAETEYPVTVTAGDRFEHLILDRTFVTDAGERWIIDYKTGRHEGGDLESFLESETSRHFLQLKRYADAMVEYDALPVRTALYFPLMKIFHEVVISGSE